MTMTIRVPRRLSRGSVDVDYGNDAADDYDIDEQANYGDRVVGITFVCL